MIHKVFLLFFLLIFLPLSASEFIELFESDITIHIDASMTVRETITVNAEGKTIRHGIVREFPTHYKDRLGTNYVVGFNLKKVLHDGKPASYFVESALNGKKIYIGEKAVYITPGTHSYTIEYDTNRQLGFFDDHDELYWNVTGNGWRLPIHEAQVVVHLPIDIPLNAVQIQAYTGFQGERGTAYNVKKIEHGFEFNTTRPLAPYQGLTIALGWPKGYIQQPRFWQKVIWFVQDNVHILIFIVGLLFLIIFYAVLWRRSQKVRPTTAIIPLFYPPADMLPGAVRYVMNKGYDDKVLAADIVAMAVQGWLTIEYKAGWLGIGSYTLHKKDKKSDPWYTQLYDALFKHNEKIVLEKHNQNTIQDLVNKETAHYSLLNNYFNFNVIPISISVVITLGLLASISFFASWVHLLIMSLIYMIVISISYWLLKSYTREGWHIKNEIEGFKLFLATTETERLKIIGTPPIRTPELFETYLPYAIALGVEEAWSRQFAPLFKKWKEEGHDYMPIWYRGRKHFNAAQFSSDFSYNFHSVISSSTSRPGGSSSGLQGRGSSGGGGGGGGGGGW